MESSLIHNYYREFSDEAIKNNWPVKYYIAESMYKDTSYMALIGVHQPWSIRLREFNYIKNFIEENNLTHGYEIATGTGMSAMAAGLAMKGKGRLVTMDAFIEENRRDSCSYNDDPKQTYENAYGWKSINQLIRAYNLEDTIFPFVGWSPDDTDAALSSVYDLETLKLDYVFIDGLHTNEAVLRDLKSVEKYINIDRYAIFLHDTHAFDSTVQDYLIKTYGKPYKVCPGCSVDEGCWNLSVVTNI